MILRPASLPQASVGEPRWEDARARGLPVGPRARLVPHWKNRKEERIRNYRRFGGGTPGFFCFFLVFSSFSWFFLLFSVFFLFLSGFVGLFLFFSDFFYCFL